MGRLPAKKLGTATPEDAAGIVQIAEVTAEMGKLHMDEAWKHPGLVRTRTRTRTRTHAHAWRTRTNGGLEAKEAFS